MLQACYDHSRRRCPSQPSDAGRSQLLRAQQCAAAITGAERCPRAAAASLFRAGSAAGGAAQRHLRPLCRPRPLDCGACAGRARCETDKPDESGAAAVSDADWTIFTCSTMNTRSSWSSVCDRAVSKARCARKVFHSGVVVLYHGVWDARGRALVVSLCVVR